MKTEKEIEDEAYKQVRAAYTKVLFPDFRTEIIFNNEVRERVKEIKEKDETKID